MPAGWPKLKKGDVRWELAEPNKFLTLNPPDLDAVSLAAHSSRSMRFELCTPAGKWTTCAEQVAAKSLFGYIYISIHLNNLNLTFIYLYLQMSLF